MNIETPEEETKNERYLAIIIRWYIETITISVTEIDKKILSLSSTILIASAGFVLHSYAKLHTFCLLYVAWSFLCISFMVTLGAHYLSASDAGKELSKAIRCFKENSEYKAEADKVLPRLNAISFSCFILGILFILIFTVLNIHSGS